MNNTISEKKLIENYEYLKHLPIVLKQKKKISKLKRENKALQRVIISFGESLNYKNTIDLTQDDSSEECSSDHILQVIGKGYAKENDTSDEEHIVYEIEEQDQKHPTVKVKQEFKQEVDNNPFESIKKKLESVQITEKQNDVECPFDFILDKEYTEEELQNLEKKMENDEE